MYRYETWLTTGGIHLELKRYHVDKETKCGVWIHSTFSKKKFINLNAKKQWACTTPELAFESFKHRKRRQESILTAQLENVKHALLLTPEQPFVKIEGLYEWDF